jgi:hypothetical protein
LTSIVSFRMMAAPVAQCGAAQKTELASLLASSSITH